MAKKLPDYTAKSWNSLCDLRDRVERDGVEKIVRFDGAVLETDRRKYRLAFGELKVSK